MRCGKEAAQVGLGGLTYNDFFDPRRPVFAQSGAKYLTAALEDENPDVFLAAVGNVAKARGIGAIAESTGLGRESLYKAIAPGAKPRYDTVLKVLHSLGVKLTVSPA